MKQIFLFIGIIISFSGCSFGNTLESGDFEKEAEKPLVKHVKVTEDVDISIPVDDAELVPETVTSAKCDKPPVDFIHETFTSYEQKNGKYIYESSLSWEDSIAFFEGKSWVLEEKQLGSHINKIYQLITKRYDIFVTQGDSDVKVRVIYQCRENMDLYKIE